MNDKIFNTLSATTIRSVLLFSLASFGNLLSSEGAQASEFSLVALSNGKAMLVVDDKLPKMYAVGSMITATSKLISTNSNSATIEVDGKKQTVFLGHAVLRSEPNKNSSVTLQASENGHFFTEGKINGGSNIRMLVDTGASFVSMSANDARRLGIDYKKGTPSRTSTANGIVPTYLVRLDSIKIGDIELFQVDASVQENDLGICLLGMSFLKRVSMVREGQQMILTKKL
ncbi:retropepsin-like aspartic protease family protein [Undibacterium flavidum]|uniref:Retroviral-like aspartic protease family protein n=1 Tax=Undibacterium flavidum TaxID=2762297 RepID=A0ABR6YFT5_9BURK|nr:retropepsin-like aspartic protease [Undibacterium flavidum]MBC3875392.1 retroviral-like aspartic protease family protein [Undibacterium flavidum]